MLANLSYISVGEFGLFYVQISMLFNERIGISLLRKYRKSPNKKASIFYFYQNQSFNPNS